MMISNSVLWRRTLKREIQYTEVQDLLKHYKARSLSCSGENTLED